MTNTWTGIHAGDYGFTGKLRIVQDNAVQDISSYTTLQFVLRDPSGTETTKTAEFTDDGTDGILQYTFADGDIDTAGIWRVQARIAKSGSELTSDDIRFLVTARLDA